MPETSLLLLHGIRGARLAQRGPEGPTTIWSLAEEFHPRSHLLALQPEPDGGSSPVHPEADIVAGPLEEEIYGRFQARFRDRKPLLTPPFDWRLAPGQSVSGLIQALRAPGTLDVVSHSMGLFLLLEALHRGWLDASRLRRIVLVTPPFCGSADIVSLLARGIDCSADDELGERRYDHCLARSFPALYRLLPGADCSACTRDWLAEETWQPLLGGPSVAHTEFLLQLAFARQDRQHWTAALRDLVRRAGDRLLILAGSGVPTLLDPDHPDAITREGDGRLPLCSTLPPGLELPRVVLGSVEDPVKHGEILNDPRALGLIDEWLGRGQVAAVHEGGRHA